MVSSSNPYAILVNRAVEAEDERAYLAGLGAPGHDATAQIQKMKLQRSENA